MTAQTSPLGDAAFLQALLDLVLPPGGNMPGAGQLGLWPEVAAGLEASADLKGVVEAGLGAIRKAALARHPGGLAGLPAEAARQVIESQQTAYPALIPLICRYLYTAYYRHPRVLEALGEPPRPPFPEGFDVEAISPGLLTSLRARQVR